MTQAYVDKKWLQKCSFFASKTFLLPRSKIAKNVLLPDLSLLDIKEGDAHKLVIFTKMKVQVICNLLVSKEPHFWAAS